MLAEFRAAVTDQLAAAIVPTLDVWDHIPDDVNVLPCVVVQRPSAAPARETNVFDMAVSVLVLGRRVDGADAELELTYLADLVWAELGGTRNAKRALDYLAVTDITPVTVAVAGVDHDAYRITVESPTTLC